ncbi:MAG: cytochrome c peroxidase [Pseudomonadota bacterium]
MTRPTMPLAILAFAALPVAADLGVPAAPVQPIDPDGYRPIDADLAALGQLLFYDPILSGNANISCGTCHHPDFGTADGVALSLGEGGVGLGPDRVAAPGNLPEQFIPRHAPGLWNLGHVEFSVMFHDGRLELDGTRPSGIRTPLGPEMEMGFASVLSAQAMFPVLSADEMAGHYSENDIAEAVRIGRITGEDGAWDLLTDRLEAIPEYRAAFTESFGPGDIQFTDVADAIAVFIEFEWRADDSPFDAYLRGERNLPEPALRGMALFYGTAGCAACHSGPFQTDHAFHATGLVQFGPGKRARFEDHRRDDGRFRVTGDPADQFAFRTPSLRNVALTAPYGHTGAYATLETFLVAHLAPRAAWDDFDRDTAILPHLPGAAPFAAVDDAQMQAAVLDAVAEPDRVLAEDEIADLVAFLHALTDPAGAAGRLGVPDAVPSGLPLDR